MKEYKKSYKGFVIWLVVFVLALLGISFLPIQDYLLVTVICCNVMTMAMAALAYIIYVNEKIYWYTGLSYEEAAKASSPARKEYARKHFVRFGAAAALFLLYSIPAVLGRIPYGVTITLAGLCIVAAAVSTMGIKLE